MAAFIGGRLMPRRFEIREMTKVWNVAASLKNTLATMSVWGTKPDLQYAVV
jgi:hypothetical protein